jgi:hypothetical protein
MEPPNRMENQCTAHSKQSGNRCRKPALPGCAVCGMHGGRAPQVMAAARLRLLAMVNPALHELARLIQKAETDSVKLSAVKDVLDRAGLAAKQLHEFSGPDGKALFDIEAVTAYIRSVDAESSRIPAPVPETESLG